MPSSCHNDSNFLFPPPFCAGNSSLPSVSPFLTSPRQAPSSFSSVCCLKPSNEIHTKQDGRLNAFLSAFLFLSSASSSFAFLSYCLLLHLPVFIVLTICPSYFPPSLFVLLFPSMGPLFFQVLFFHFSLLISTVVFVCVYPSFLFPRHSFLPLSLLSYVFLHFHSFRPNLEARWLYFHLFI